MPDCRACGAFVMEGAPTCGECGRATGWPEPPGKQALRSLAPTRWDRVTTRWRPPPAEQVREGVGVLGLGTKRSRGVTVVGALLPLTEQQAYDSLLNESCIVCGRQPDKGRWSVSFEECVVCLLRTCSGCQDQTTRREGIFLLHDEVWSCQACGSERWVYMGGEIG